MAHPRGQFCKKCGYDLAGIASAVCPECSRPFTPGDDSTYHTIPPSTRRRRFWRRVVIAAVTIVLLAALFPRGYVQATFIVGRASGNSIQTVRTELVPPRWLNRLATIRYPGWTSRGEAPPQPPKRFVSFTARSGAFTLRGVKSGGSCSAWGDAAEAGTMTINDVLATPENAAALFETILPDMAAGRSYGVSLGSLPTKPDGAINRQRPDGPR